MHFQEDTKKFGGWQNKTAALVHIQQSGRQELLNKNLEMLSSHHSLQKLPNKIDCKVKDKGDKVYKQYIWMTNAFKAKKKDWLACAASCMLMQAFVGFEP